MNSITGTTQETSVQKPAQSEEESKPLKEEDIKEKADDNMEVVNEEKSSIEEPKKEEQKMETTSTDVEMKPVEAKDHPPGAVNEEQPDGNSVSSVPVVQVCVLVCLCKQVFCESHFVMPCL